MKHTMDKKSRHQRHRDEPHEKRSKSAKSGKTQSVSLLKTHKNVMQCSRSLWIESLAKCCDNFMKEFRQWKVPQNSKTHNKICMLAVLAFIRLFDSRILLFNVLLCPLLFFFFSFSFFLYLNFSNFTCCVKWFLGMLLSSGVYFICNNDTKTLIKDRFLFIFAASEHSYSCIMQWRENKISEFHPSAMSRKPR